MSFRHKSCPFYSVIMKMCTFEISRSQISFDIYINDTVDRVPWGGINQILPIGALICIICTSCIVVSCTAVTYSSVDRGSSWHKTTTIAEHLRQIQVHFVCPFPCFREHGGPEKVR